MASGLTAPCDREIVDAGTSLRHGLRSIFAPEIAQIHVGKNRQVLPYIEAGRFRRAGDPTEQQNTVRRGGVRKYREAYRCTQGGG